jgi:hypothetical protein
MMTGTQVDEAFFETWCDVLISSGWQRDQIKASNWVLIQYRCRPKEASASPVPPGADGRTAERWFLIEELVPKEYLQSLVEGKVRSQLSPRGRSLIASLDKGQDRPRRLLPPLRSPKAKVEQRQRQDAPGHLLQQSLGLGPTLEPTTALVASAGRVRLPARSG